MTTRLQTILKLSPVGVGVTRARDGMIVDFNDALLKVIGWERADIVGRTSLEIDLWADKSEREKVFARIAAGENLHELPIKIRRKDGEIRDVLFSATAILLDQEPHFIGNLRDITDELLIARERDKAVQRLKMSLSVMPTSVFHQDLELRYTFITNPQIGQPVDAIVGRFDHELFEPADAEVLTAIKRRVLERAVGERHEIPVHVGGDLRWFDTLVEPERNPEGAVIGLLCAGTDITERKQREERYRSVLEDQTELIARFRPDGVMIYVNAVYCRFFGKTEAQLVGHCWHPEAHPDDIPAIEARLATLSRENPFVLIENRVIGADGNWYWVQFINRGFFDGSGKLREIQSVGRDISERKRIEAELAASRLELHALFEAADRQREAQRKQIAQEIHDHLGAALTAISFRIEVLNDLAANSASLVPEINRIKALVANARQSARDICNTLRPPVLDDLGLIEACRWYLKDWSKLVGIQSRSRFSPLLREPSEQLSTDLFRILQELLTNVARHSGASAVRVSISQAGSCLKLRVVDDGHGFIPSDGRRNGFGLSGIRERISRYGGDVAIVSGTTGTTVTVSVVAGDSE